jgi:hypothetical protein
LSQAQQKANRRKSKIRAPGRAHLRRAGKRTTIVPTIGVVQPRAKFGLQNLVYNSPKHAVHAGRSQVRQESDQVVPKGHRVNKGRRVRRASASGKHG